MRQTPLDRGPEHLVGIGFRCWLAGYETGEIACWEQAWTAYAAALGPIDAKRALGDLVLLGARGQGPCATPHRNLPARMQGLLP